METSTSFDLNLAIQRWREDLGQSPAFRSENLNELESHLRDSIATLQTRGLSAGESFMVATNRIGKGGALETEFAKVNARAVWLDRILWMLIGVQVWGLVSSVIGSVARNALAFGWTNANNSHMESGLVIQVTLFMFTLTQVLATAASIALCWWLIVRKGQRLGAWFGPLLRRRSTLVATWAALCLLSLVFYSLSYGIPIFLVKSLGPEVYGRTLMYSTSRYSNLIVYAGYSNLIAWPIQVVAMTALTLGLARKRLRTSCDLSATC